MRWRRPNLNGEDGLKPKSREVDLSFVESEWPVGKRVSGQFSDCVANTESPIVRLSMGDNEHIARV
jgi:hypothetical protein